MSDVIRPARKGSRWTVPQDRRYLVCRVTPGNRWWDLDDEVAAVPGRRDAYAKSVHRWHAIPEDRLSDLQAIAERNPRRLVVHRIR